MPSPLLSHRLQDSDEDDAADIDTAELAYRLRLQRRAAHIQQTLLGTMRLVLGECVARPRLAVEETAAWAGRTGNGRS